MKNGAPYLRPDSRGDRFPMVDTGKHHCLTPRCRGVVNKKTEKSPYCYHCRFVRWRDKNPLRYSFGNLRRRAKERGKDFNLTFQEYRDFAVKTNYAKLKGKSSLSLSVDRIDNSKGYTASNIRAISLSENSRRQFVPFWAHQMENIAYKPSDADLAEVAQQL